MSNKTNKTVSRSEVERLLSIADRRGSLDLALRNLQGANFYAIKSPDYYRIEKANKMAAEAAKMRTKAIAALAEQLCSQTDGWTQEEVARAAEAAIDAK